MRPHVKAKTEQERQPPDLLGKGISIDSIRTVSVETINESNEITITFVLIDSRALLSWES